MVIQQDRRGTCDGGSGYGYGYGVYTYMRRQRIMKRECAWKDRERVDVLNCDRLEHKASGDLSSTSSDCDEERKGTCLVLRRA